MARAARGTAKPARAAGERRCSQRHRKAASSRAALSMAAAAGGSVSHQQTAVVEAGHGARTAMKSLEPCKPDANRVQLFATSQFCDLAVCDLALRILSTAISVCLSAGARAVTEAGLAFRPNHRTNRFVPECLRGLRRVTKPRHRQNLPFCSPIRGTKDRRAAFRLLFAALTFVCRLAARSSVRLRTQPNTALLLTH